MREKNNIDCDIDRDIKVININLNSSILLIILTMRKLNILKDVQF